MRIGIAGAGGFIGSHLVKTLTPRYDITILERDERSQYSLTTIAALKKIDTIVFLAGMNRGDDKEIIHGNTVSLFTLLRGLHSENIKPNIVLSSSLQVYGFDNKPISHVETEIPTPSSVYGLSKLMAERIADDYCRTSHRSGFSLRIANVYGPGCKPNYNSIIATFEGRIRKGQPLIINGSGRQGRDFIHVDDVVSAIEKAVLRVNDRSIGMKPLNVCTGSITEIETLAEAMMKALKKNVQIKHPNPGADTDFLVGNPQKAKKELGFSSSIGIEEGLSKLRIEGRVKSPCHH